jgi:NTE family protein
VQHTLKMAENQEKRRALAPSCDPKDSTGSQDIFRKSNGRQVVAYVDFPRCNSVQISVLLHPVSAMTNAMAMARRFFLATLLCTLSLPAHALQSRDEHRPATRTIQPMYGEARQLIPNFLPYQSVKRPKVAVVLSGGGARGIAAIGVLEVLEQARIPIDLIVGTSIGSILGGLYASGYSTEQLRRMVDTTNWEDVLSLSDEARRSDLFLDQKIAADRSILTVRFQGLKPILPEALSTGQRLTNYLNLLVLQGIYHPSPLFDDLRIPFRAVTTDLVSGKQVVLDRGDLTEAMRASVSVPLLFSPVVQDTTQLLDGGLVSNIPVDVARRWGADIVIAVDMTSPLRPASKLHAPWEIADQILGITMQSANQDQLRNADIVVRPELGNHLSDDFSDLDTLIQKGSDAAEAMVGRIDTMIREKETELTESYAGNAVFSNARFDFDALQLDEGWLTRVMALAREREISEFEVQRIVDLMYESGDFERVGVDVREDSAGTHLRLDCPPNPVLSSVEIIGSRVVGLDTLQAVFQPLIGRRLNFHQSQEAMEAVLGIYRDRGYSLARIREARLNPVTGRAAVVIDEGIVYRMDIVGTTKTKDYVIWRELPWKDGDVFQAAKVAEGIARLYATNLFEQVSINVHQEGARDEYQVVVINLRERSTELIRFGLRIDNERSVQPSIDVRDENLFGIGAELGIHAYGGSRNRSVVGEFKAMRIFNTYLTFGLRGTYAFRDVNVYGDEPITDPKRWDRVLVGEYRELHQGATVTFGTQLERLGTVAVEGRLENHRVWSISGNPVETQSYRIGSIRFGTKVDSRDRYPFPRSGVAMDFSYESALLPAKGGTGFTKMSLAYDAYQTYDRRNTLHERVLFGFADQTLPITEQFSLGGQENFYGLREDNSRGRQLFVASLEYRYQPPFKIFFDTYLTARYDLGSIWSTAAEIHLQDLRHGIGVGLALDTPIGPAEIAIGQSFYIRKDILNNPISRGPFLGYFSIGYAF